MADSKIWYNDANHAAGQFENCAVHVWRGVETFEHFDTDTQAPMRRLVEQNPAGVLSLMVFEESASLPKEAGRKKLGAAGAARGQHVLGTAMVVMGTGMRQTAVRAAGTAILLLIPNRQSIKTFEDIGAGARWLQSLTKHAGLQGGFDAWVAFIQQLRRVPA